MVSDSVRMSEEAKSATRLSTVMAAIRQRIASRSLTSGDKLPSIRSFAGTMQVSTSTVVEAYDRLVAEGVIQSRPGSGFYVASQAAPLALSEVGPKLDRAIDPFWVSRQSLAAGDADLKPGCGWLPPSWLPEDGVRRALRTLSRANGPVLADYGAPLGLPPLRQLMMTCRRTCTRSVARNAAAFTLSRVASAAPWAEASQPTASMQLSGPRFPVRFISSS